MTLALSGAFQASGQDLFPGNMDGIDQDLHPTDVIIWQPVSGDQAGLLVTIGVRLQTKQNFTIYKKNIQFKGPPGFELINLEAPPPMVIEDPMGEGQTEVYGGGDFLVSFRSLSPLDANPFELAITFLGCTERICLFPYTQTLSVPVFQSKPPPPQKIDESATLPKETQHEVSSEGSLAEQVERGTLPLSVLLIVLFVGGLATNLTPCVFPMIPITMRILGKQGHAPFSSSLVYALGILITYSSLGIVAAFSGGLFGSFMASPVVGVVFSALFILLALTMLGFGDLSKLQTIGSRIGGGEKGFLNTLLMGAGAGLVAAPCTGPILGGLLAFTAKKQDPSLAIFLFTIYSFGFALPYVFLGSMAGKAAKIQVSASIQVGVKLAFAAAMFGLGFYYLRIPLHGQLDSLTGYWLPVALTTMVMGLGAMGFYLLKQMDHKALSVLPSLVLGLGLFASTQWLTGKDIISELHWHKSVEAGMEAAAQSQKPILIDGWAEWCEACKKMDATTYVHPQVIEELSKHWVLVKLDFTEMTDDQVALSEKYDMQGLPVTLLLPHDGDLGQQKRLTGYLSHEELLTHTKDYRDR